MKTTQRKFAEIEHVTRQRVNQWVRAKIISLDSSGKIDVDKAREELRRNRDESKRLDWEASHRLRREIAEVAEIGDDGDGPPRPFTGSITRDISIMALRVFYDHYVNVIAPILLKVYRKSCHIDRRSAEGLTILFGCKTHEIIKSFLEEDVFDQWLRKNEDTSTDKLDAILSGRVGRKTLPPRDLPIMQHPNFILGLLKKQKQKKKSKV